jgi:integrase
MTHMNREKAQVIRFPQTEKVKDKPRKTGLNTNKEGSVRKINGKVYIDFMYLGERARECSDLAWNEKNARHVRQQLDKIIVEINSGSFKFAEVFPNSKKADYFSEKERLLFGLNKTPDQVLFNDFALIWYDLLKDSGRVSERTLWGYKSYLDRYLKPYFGNLSFGEFNKIRFTKFISWAKRQKLRKKQISNETVNKIFVPMKMICKDAAIEYGWGSIYNPFFGFKKLPPESDSYKEIFPFSMDEQNKISVSLPDHWKPYFDAAFKIGLRQGEQNAIKPNDIDWLNGLLHIRRAITLDKNGKLVEGGTKNRYSRRVIKLIPIMIQALKAQKKIYDSFKCEYFFCTTNGERVDPSNLRRRIWNPSLKKAGVELRQMKQTRHSFATNALSCGENPLWIAKIMGHRDTNMIIKVYSKFIENAAGFKDGTNLNSIYQGSINSKG